VWHGRRRCEKGWKEGGHAWMVWCKEVSKRGRGSEAEDSGEICEHASNGPWVKEWIQWARPAESDRAHAPNNIQSECTTTQRPRREHSLRLRPPPALLSLRERARKSVVGLHTRAFTRLRSMKARAASWLMAWLRMRYASARCAVSAEHDEGSDSESDGSRGPKVMRASKWHLKGKQAC
jgi:hypothetical protein